MSYLLCDSNSSRFSWEDKMCYFTGKEVDIYKIIMLDTTLKLSSELQMHPILKNKTEEFSEYSSESIRN